MDALYLDEQPNIPFKNDNEENDVVAEIEDEGLDGRNNEESDIYQSQKLQQKHRKGGGGKKWKEEEIDSLLECVDTMFPTGNKPYCKSNWFI